MNTDHKLDIRELTLYLKHTAFPMKNFTATQVESIFTSIDADESGYISKDEMVMFLKVILTLIKSG